MDAGVIIADLVKRVFEFMDTVSFTLFGVTFNLFQLYIFVFALVVFFTFVNWFVRR